MMRKLVTAGLFVQEYAAVSALLGAKYHDSVQTQIIRRKKIQTSS
jgi:hypothetical protein